MNRWWIAVLLPALLVPGCRPDPGRRAEDPRPNVLLVTFDRQTQPGEP